MTHLEIEAFMEIVRTGSISAAAQSLFVTQPALSRRIRALEEELGYCVMERNKGRRSVELTERGKAFVRVAEKWLNVWQEAREIRTLGSRRVFGVSSVGSVSTYLLPAVFQGFLETNPDIRLCFHNYHSAEAYDYVSGKMVDIALISDDMYSRTVETIPAFREPMVLVMNRGGKGGIKLHPSQLKPEAEIRLPWNPEYDLWHDYWFDSDSGCKVSLDQMSLMEYFLLSEGAWAVVPLSAADRLLNLPYIVLCELEEGPPDRIIYYLKGRRKETDLMNRFLRILHGELLKRPRIESFLA